MRNENSRFFIRVNLTSIRRVAMTAWPSREEEGEERKTLFISIHYHHYILSLINIITSRWRWSITIITPTNHRHHTVQIHHYFLPNLFIINIINKIRLRSVLSSYNNLITSHTHTSISHFYFISSHGSRKRNKCTTTKNKKTASTKIKYCAGKWIM